MSVLAPAYRPRRPAETVLYQVVAANLETFLAHARETYQAPLPRYVEQELRGYLACGIFAHGFVRAHCDACGHDLLVAFSCKGRAVCPSCAALEACAAIAMQRGAMRALRDDANAEPPDAPGMGAPPRGEGAVEHNGFNLHASVAIAAADDLGRERLMRYGARPALALDRLRRLPGGRIGYRVKKFRDGRAKHLVMTPLELLARLAAIVPPPR